MNKKATSVPAILALLAALQPQPGRAAAAAATAQPAPADFQLAPKMGQNDVQQWFDRHECDSWARQQTGYDASGEQESAAQAAAGKEYVRAMTACLIQRDYEVRYAPEPPPPSPPPYVPPRAEPSVRELRARVLSADLGGGYSLPTGSSADYVHGGAHAGAALDWFPSAALPVGLRLAGNYIWLKPGGQLFALNGVGYNRGEQNLYGGDVDLRLNLARFPTRQQLYLVAGLGWYRIDTTLQKVAGVRQCGVNYCAIFQTLLAQEHDTSPVESAWNAGLGWEIALDSHTAFFLEAGYRHIRREGGSLQLVPISLGLRF